MHAKTVYISTIGCQMNVYDSDQIAGALATIGYQTELFMERAGVIFVNTCAIREKAEQKAYSLLGRLAGLKRRNPDLIIVAGGCVAQQEGERMLRRVPHLDLVIGTDAYRRLPGLIQKIAVKKCRIADVNPAEAVNPAEPVLTSPAGDDRSAVTKFVTVMRGCDNYCAYCVVPYVRGSERSRDPDAIIGEVEAAVANGVKEVTLLGQNVNSFGKKGGRATFPQLLARLNRIEGLLRIRFTTSHPKDLSEDLIRAFGKLDKLCRHIHLPVQSGSDRILGMMNRRYTRRQYLEKVETLRAVSPEIAITTDIIVGFPGETDDDFNQTMDLIREVSYDNLFAFKYSDRPQTRATRLAGKLPDAVKADRLQQVLAVQKGQTLSKNRGRVGKTEGVLVEGISKKEKRGAPDMTRHNLEWSGRTESNRVVNFVTNGSAILHEQIVPGALVSVLLESAYANSLFGKVQDVIQRGTDLKGEHSNAA